MSESNMTVSIESLKGKHFVVKDYQRGYKWTAQQVLDLLEDVSSFNIEEDAFYCLQPLALVELDGGKSYEVIDGQQRLTTVYIILSLLDAPLFSVSYNTRLGSEYFLEGIRSILDCDVVELVPSAATMKEFEESLKEKWFKYIEEHYKDDNTDTFHFYTAAQTILSWKAHNEEKAITLIKNLKEHTRFIWYVEPREKDAKVVFRNLNSGKIPLTNAELIKADFINGMKNSNIEIQTLKQNELASEWDIIEKELYNNHFWFFINNETSSEIYETRIDFLFELLLGGRPKNNEDSLYIYRQFLQKKESGLDWLEVKLCFYQLKEWFEDSELYHLIGYIVSQRLYSIYEILEISKGCGKQKFKESLVAWIRNDFAKMNLNEASCFLDALHYETTANWLVKVLLVYNLEIYQRSSAHFRFPFDLFKHQKWSLEHIHAQNAKEFETIHELKDWLSDIKELNNCYDTKSIDAITSEFPQEKLLQIEKKIQGRTNNQEEISDEIKTLVSEVDSSLIEYFQIHSISNMALLDGGTNSSFSNKAFKAKRSLLIEIDRKKWVEGDNGKKAFIPIGTKNVFLKHTSQNVDQMSVWGSQDRLDYRKHIESTIKYFLPGHNAEGVSYAEL